VNSDWLAGPLFWAGFVLSLPQAMRLRRRALRLGPAEGPTEGCSGRGPRRRLVGIGDSIIAGVGADRTEAMLTARVAECWAERCGVEVEWRAIGRNGADAAATQTKLLPRLPPASVDHFLVSVGVNDVTGLHSVRRWRADLDGLLEALARHSPAASICLLAIPPMERFPALPWPLAEVFGLRARTFNRATAALIVGRSGIAHPEYTALGPRSAEAFAADGYHPNADSCRQLAELLAAEITFGPGAA